MDGHEHRRFGLAVELLHVDAKRAVEVEDLGPDRLARGVGHAHATHAERVLERPVDQEIAQRIEQPVGGGDRPAVEQRRSDPAGERHEGLEHAALEEARVLHADGDLGDQVLEHARRRKVIGRADLAQVGHHRGSRIRDSSPPGRRRSPGHRRRCDRPPRPSAGRRAARRLPGGRRIPRRRGPPTRDCRSSTPRPWAGRWCPRYRA